MDPRLPFLLAALALPLVTIGCAAGSTGAAGLTTSYYTTLCPQFEDIVKQETAKYTTGTFPGTNPSTPASLLRLHFHDCFVVGCDASVLLKAENNPGNGKAERDADPNLTLAAFECVDSIKTRLEAACPGVVSCADILAEAARYAIIQAGGPDVKVRLGRKDGSVSLEANALKFLPPHTANVDGLTEVFKAVGLAQQDIVPLSGAHTFGRGHCGNIEVSLAAAVMDETYKQTLQKTCPAHTDSIPVPQQNTAPMDPITPLSFDNKYFVSLLARTGMFFSDRVLAADKRTKDTVSKFASNQTAFFEAFVVSCLRMSELSVLTGNEGEIRKTCGYTNQYVKDHPAVLTASTPMGQLTGGQTSGCSWAFKGSKLTFTGCATLAGGFSLAWNLSDDRTLTFGVSKEADGWVGFGLGGQMIGSSPFVMFRGDSGVVVKNYFIGGKTAAVVTPNGKANAISMEGEAMGSSLRMLVKLGGVAADTNGVIWASGPKLAGSDTLLTQHPGGEGRMGTVNFATGGLSTDNTNRDLRTSHGVLQVVAWGIILPLGTFSPRHLRAQDPLWYFLHIGLQITGFLIGTGGFVIGLILRERTERTYTSHFTLALIAYTLAGMQILSLVIRPHKDNSIRWLWTLLHGSVGRIVIVTAIWNIYIGFDIMVTPQPYVIAYSTFLGVMVASWLYLEGKRVYESLVEDIAVRVQDISSGSMKSPAAKRTMSSGVVISTMVGNPEDSPVASPRADPNLGQRKKKP